MATKKQTAAERWREVPRQVRTNIVRELGDEMACHARQLPLCETREQRSFWRGEIAAYRAAIAVLREAAKAKAGRAKR